MDNYLIEAMSSGCAIVGFFVGYSVMVGKKYSDACESRLGQAETSVDLMLLPPLCRPDNLGEKTKSCSRRKKSTTLKLKLLPANRAASPHQAPRMTSRTSLP